MATRRKPSAPLPFEGHVLGGFRIASPIATGGMATVYLGRKTGPGRYAQMAAIKVIHPHLAQNRELTEMFLDEARLASCVNHPNVCRVLDFGEAEGTFYLAMEYVRGENFADVLKAFDEHAESRARLSILSAHVLAQACEGLHAIHEAGDAEGRPLRIVHRDVSPQNLLVAYDGSIRLLDFGIASAEGRAHTGSTDVVRGRYAYMAPEQMRGLDLDRRADIWSLGVILREAVTGQNPYLRESQIATMLAVTQEPPPNWPSSAEARLRAITELCLSRVPEERFASARELGDALTRYLSERNESALSTELSQHMRKVFAREIAEKRAALRALAEDDTYVDTFSSGYPAMTVSAAPARITERPAQVSRVESKKEKKPHGALWAALGALVTLALIGTWLATRGYFNAPEPLANDRGTGAPRREPAVAASATRRAQPVDARERDEEHLPQVEALAIAAREPPAAGDAQRTETSTEEPKTKEPASAVRPSALVARGSTRANSEEKRGAGTVVIGTSQGWATIFDKGKKLGNTPLRTELGAGTHTLVIRPYGEGSARRISVDVQPGETIKLRVEL
jgi:eukaryotic-like serine/threonine-protein kinase